MIKLIASTNLNLNESRLTQSKEENYKKETTMKNLFEYICLCIGMLLFGVRDCPVESEYDYRNKEERETS